MIDWEKIKSEYITEEVTYQQLAEKYHVTQRTIAKHGAAEKWQEQREKKSPETQRLPAAEEDALRRTRRLLTVADQMLDKVAQALNEPDTLSGTELRSLAGTLKNIKEIQMIQSPLDEKEQRIKIASLERQAEKKEEAGITVVLEEGVRDYAQ